MNRALAIGLLSTLLSGLAHAAVLPAHIFSDHMVLQRDKPIPVWGWDDPGQSVTVEMNGATQTATTGADGRWTVTLPALKTSTAPATMTIHDKDGAVTITDILVGDVWVCSGQSNMEFQLGGANESHDAIVAADKLTQIRLLLVSKAVSGIPADDTDATWTTCTTATAAHFSAVGFFFGKAVSEKIGVPIGLIQSTWGGTPIQPWTPRDGFALDDKLKGDLPALDQVQSQLRATVPAKLPDIERWLARTKAALATNSPLPALPAWPVDPLALNGNPSKDTVLFNAMIHPLIPFAIRGVLWYQGESNHGDALYADRLHALIRSWRQLWAQGDFPFYFVQIAPLGIVYAKGELIDLWQAQSSCLDLPNTGMAVTNDIGDLATIHPKDKRDVGERLARIAFAKEYALPGIIFSGPVYKSMQIDGGKIRLTFDYAEGGLAVRDGQPLSWFEIAGADGNFVAADAAIDGQQVVVSSAQVPAPTAVRFAWGNNAVPNLMNHEGLPAPAFNTALSAHAASP